MEALRLFIYVVFSLYVESSRGRFVHHINDRLDSVLRTLFIPGTGCSLNQGFSVSYFSYPCELGLQNTPTASLQDSPNECPGYYIKQSDGEAPIMQKL